MGRMGERREEKAEPEKELAPQASGSGLAVAAIVAPAASARVYEVGGAQSDSGSSAVIKGDDKVIAGVESGGMVIKGDDKVLTPAPKTGMFVRGGDDKVILTPADWQYNEHGTCRAITASFRRRTRAPSRSRPRVASPLAARSPAVTGTGATRLGGCPRRRGRCTRSCRHRVRCGALHARHGPPGQPWSLPARAGPSGPACAVLAG